MNKPTVHFVGDATFFDYADDPDAPVAKVDAIDHPVWGSDVVRTSIVLNKFDDGSFETLNTIYKPYKDEIQNPP